MISESIRNLDYRHESSISTRIELKWVFIVQVCCSDAEQSHFNSNRVEMSFTDQWMFSYYIFYLFQVGSKLNEF